MNCDCEYREYHVLCDKPIRCTYHRFSCESATLLAATPCIACRRFTVFSCNLIVARIWRLNGNFIQIKLVFVIDESMVLLHARVVIGVRVVGYTTTAAMHILLTSNAYSTISKVTSRSIVFTKTYEFVGVLVVCVSMNRMGSTHHKHTHTSSCLHSPIHYNGLHSI